MNDVTIISILSKENPLSKYCFEKNVISKIGFVETGLNDPLYEGIQIDGVKVEILASSDYDVNYDNCSIYVHEEEIHEPSAFKFLIEQSKSEFICVLNNNTIHKRGWLMEMMYYYNNINNSGIVGIAHNFDEKEYSPLLNKEGENTNVFLSKNNSVFGTCLFKKEYTDKIISINKISQSYSYEINQLLPKKITGISFNNYYVPSQMSVYLGR